MRYNKVETAGHIISQSNQSCVKDFNIIICAEDDNLVAVPNFFVDVEVLDLDCVEVFKAKLQSRNRVRTMDCCYVVSDAVGLKVVLVELRFNYRNLSNLSRQVLIEKVAGSISIMGSSVNVCPDYIFIFQSNLVQQAVSRLQRMNPRIPNNYIAMDLSELISRDFK